MKKGHIKLLEIISDGDIYSGEKLATCLNVSRVAIWKSIKYLKNLGLEIEAIRGKGYRLHNKYEFLSERNIRDMMSQIANESCRDIEIAFKIKSTNFSLMNRLNHESIHGSVMFAEYQSDGKGRRNKKWLSPIGSGICFSIGWRFEVMSIPLGLLSIYMGIAVARALNSLGIKNVGLKWPNDIVVMQSKIGGILLDIRGESAGPLDVIIGIGINYESVKYEELDIDQPVTDICSVIKERISRNMTAAVLLSNVFEILKDLQIGKNLDLVDEWRQYDCYTGRKAKLILPHEEVTGILKGIDEEGSLLISVEGRLSAYRSGEVSLRVQ